MTMSVSLQRRFRIRQGFTLVELLVVIAIIGVLVGFTARTTSSNWASLCTASTTPRAAFPL
jgi:prepilin-type N-terminal cleavage/methylation domain-containing protein